jgi:LysR family transcriptional regulator, hydrogen peroxide-inducible genes activator
MCTIGPHRLVDLFSVFRAGYDGIEIYLKDAPASTLEELLSKGEIDVALFCTSRTTSRVPTANTRTTCAPSARKSAVSS